MDFSFSETQRELRERYAAFGKKVAERAPELFDANSFDHESWRALCNTGFWKMIVPEVYGGNGENWWDFTAALEGIASTACDGGFLLTLISQAAFIRGLSLYGTKTQCKRYFPGLLEGKLTATAIAESHSGTDTHAVRTYAKKEGNNYYLYGEKWNIAHAPTADLILVVGRIPELGKHDITLFIAERGMPGLESGEAQPKMGNRTIPTSWLKFTATPLTYDHILGGPGNGLRTLIHTVSIGRIYHALTGVTLLEPVYKAALAYIQTRESFRQKLKDHQHVQEHIISMKSGMEKSRWLSYASLWQLLNGHPDALMNASIAKLTGTDAFLDASQRAMVLFGSRGYLEGTVSRMVRDALGFVSVGGTIEMHKKTVFNQIMLRWRSENEKTQ